VNGAASSVQIGSGSAYTVAYGYDDTLRLNSVTYNNGMPFTYSYVANSSLIDTVAQGGSYLRDYDHPTNSNRLATVKHSWSNLTASRMESRLDYDFVGRRSTEKTQGTGFLSALGRPGDPGVHIPIQKGLV
jgi:hypothetical protein